MSAANVIEYDGSGNARTVRSAPAARTKTGKYGIYDASATVPRAYPGGMGVAKALFSSLDRIKAVLFSERSRLGAAGKADVAVWFGPGRGWTWVENAPYPGALTFVEWRDGCSRCGSLEHTRCKAKLGTFSPEPPVKVVPAATHSQSKIAGGVPFARTREYVSPEEQAEFNRVGREYPHLVAAARQSTGTLVAAYRMVVRNLKAMEVRNASDR
jgi:hypothetical protein